MTRDTYACGDCAVVVDVARTGRFWHAGVGKWLCGKCFDAAHEAEKAKSQPSLCDALDAVRAALGDEP